MIRPLPRNAVESVIMHLTICWQVNRNFPSESERQRNLNTLQTVIDETGFKRRSVGLERGPQQAWICFL